jgi:hypothetical protein
VAEAGVQLPAAPADGFHVHAGDKGEAAVAAAADLLGFQGDQPAPLGLVEATEQDVKPPVPSPVGVVRAGGTMRALAVVDLHGRNALAKRMGAKPESL